MDGTPSHGTLQPAGDRSDRGHVDCNVVLAANLGGRKSTLKITITKIDMRYTEKDYEYYRDEYNPDYQEIGLDKPQFDGKTCLDWLEVRDGDSQGSELLGEYCGNKELLSLPITIKSSGKNVWVR